MLTTEKVMQSKEISGEATFDDSERVKIASISFAYGNKDIIKTLTKRGTLLTKGKLNGIQNIENRINKLVQ